MKDMTHSLQFGNYFTTMRKLIAAASLLAITPASYAYLGSFEQTEGYKPFLDMVQNYNAGQYGPNSGYPATNVYTPIVPNSGPWKVVPGSGGFFSLGTVSYATGHQNFDRTWVNSNQTMGAAADQGLVLTTSHLGWGGPALEYGYNLDEQDLGINPNSTANSLINLSFWWCTELAGLEIGGALPDGYFGDEIEFLDSSGNAGFRLGLTQRGSADKVTYETGTTGMVESTIVAASDHYDRWDITLDLINDTVSANYYSFGTNTLNPLFTNQSMISPMNDFSKMTFRTSPGVNNAKLMAVDDFKFNVTGTIPEPSTFPLLSIGIASLLLRRNNWG